MRLIKLGFISAVVLFIVITGISLLLPSSIIISRAIDIHADLSVVYPKVAKLSNWKQWYAFNDTTVFSVSSNDSGRGAELTIDNSKITLGEVTNKKIKAFWSLHENNQMQGEFNFITTDSINASHITIQWQVIHKVKWYPWEKFASIVADKSIGSFMEESLDRLKVISEK